MLHYTNGMPQLGRIPHFEIKITKILQVKNLSNTANPNVSLNPLMPALAVTGCDERWPLFHF